MLFIVSLKLLTKKSPKQLLLHNNSLFLAKGSKSSGCVAEVKFWYVKNMFKKAEELPYSSLR